MKAEKDFGENFFWILGDMPRPNTEQKFEYYIIPSSVMAKNVAGGHRPWLSTPGVKGRQHKDRPVRTLDLPPYKANYGELDLNDYLDRWDLIEEQLRD